MELGAVRWLAPWFPALTGPTGRIRNGDSAREIPAVKPSWLTSPACELWKIRNSRIPDLPPFCQAIPMPNHIRRFNPRVDVAAGQQPPPYGTGTAANKPGGVSTWRDYQAGKPTTTTGWIDILTGANSFPGANGEYFVFVE